MRILRSNIVSIAATMAVLCAVAGLAVFASFASAETGGPNVVLTSSSATTTNSGSIAITATFSEDVSGFDASDIVAASSTVSDFASTSASVYTFNINPTSEGQVTVMVPADVASSTASTTLGNQESNTLSFTSDTSDPTISDVSVATTTTTATIDWNTSEPASGQVMYGTTTAYGSNSTLVTSLNNAHTATLTGLSPNTTYFFEIQSEDAAGNMATSTGSFTTAASPLAPAISGITVSGISSTSVTVSWSTNLPASGQVMFGTTSAYGQTSSYNGTASTTHSFTLTGLQEGTMYHFAVSSGNETGTTTSSDQTFITQSTSSSTPLALTGVDSVDTSAVADGTFENGWRFVMHFTVPDNENALRMQFSNWVMNGASSTTFATANNIRLSSPQSSNASTTGSGIMVTGANTYSDWIYLTGDSATGTPGRQVSVTVEVRIPVGTTPGAYTSSFVANTTPSTATSTTP